MKKLILSDRKLTAVLLWRVMNWHLRYLFTKTARPLACGLLITTKCNFRCSFCNYWRKPGSLTLPYEKAKSIIGDISRIGAFYFSVSGGEPLLVDYLFDLLKYARNSNIRYIHLVTNGYLLDKTRAIEINNAGLNEVSISIDGSEKYHDSRRQAQGAYQKAIQAVQNLKQYAPKAKIALNVILDPAYPDECLHAVDLAGKLGVFAKIQPLNEHYKFDKNNCASYAAGLAQPEELKRTVAILKKTPYLINSKVFLDNIYDFFYLKDVGLFKDEPCLFGFHNLEIMEDASVFPCSEGMEWKKTFEYDGDLPGLLSSKKYRSALEGLKNCRGCRRTYYVCYYESRIAFPVNNFLKFLFYRKKVSK